MIIGNVYRGIFSVKLVKEGRSPEILVEKLKNLEIEGHMVHSDLTEALKSLD